MAKFKKKVETDSGNTVSERQIANRHREKAKRLKALQGQINDIRKQVDLDIKAKDDKKAQTALAVGLIDHTYERVGNEGSAEEGHFGVTGWEVKHLTFSGSTATLSYVGKSGVSHEKTVKDATLVKALKRVTKGKEGGDQILDLIQADDVNAYLEPFGATAKDLRGYHANREMRERLEEALKGPLPTETKKRDKALQDAWKKALRGTAEAVGHEPATLDSQYLVPGLKDSFLKDGTIQPPGKTSGRLMLARIVARWMVNQR